VQTALINVRFEGNNGHYAEATRCLLMTQSGHSRRAMLIRLLPRLELPFEHCDPVAQLDGFELRVHGGENVVRASYRSEIARR
jgi:hypothetical protein